MFHIPAEVREALTGDRSEDMDDIEAENLRAVLDGSAELLRSCRTAVDATDFSFAEKICST
jgi:hypothetical protein